MAVQETVAPRLRRDAARNRERVIAAGRAALDAGLTLQLNDIARAAGVGVGTVYRHFPTTTELLETLVADKFDTLIVEARSAATLEKAGQALESFLNVAWRLWSHFAWSDPICILTTSFPSESLSSSAPTVTS